MTTIGVWASWIGDPDDASTAAGATPASMAAVPGAAGSGAETGGVGGEGGGAGYGGGGGVGRAGGAEGGGRGGRGGRRGGADGGVGDGAAEAASPYMAEQRKKQAEELKDPKVRADVIGLISREQTGERNRSMVLEALSNRARMRGHTLEQEMHSGFYGPVGPGPRGRHTGAIPQPQNETDRKIGEAAIARVLGGQNLLESTTDQGSKNDPNFGKYKADPNRYHTRYTTGQTWKEGAEQFADINPAWGARDRSAQSAYDRAHPAPAAARSGVGAGQAGYGGAGVGQSGGFAAAGTGPPAPAQTLSAHITGRNAAGAQTGYITTPQGHTYPFVTGGRGRGPAPVGEYAMGGREYHPILHGSSYHISDKYDPRIASMRRGLFLHRGDHGVTHGCIGVPSKYFDALERDIRDSHARRLRLSNGAAPAGATTGAGM